MKTVILEKVMVWNLHIIDSIHTLQENFRSFECRFMCCVMLPRRLKPAPHWGHSNVLLLLCTVLCCRNWIRRWNFLSQTAQEYGVTFKCTFLCSLRWNLERYLVRQKNKKQRNLVKETNFQHIFRRSYMKLKLSFKLKDLLRWEWFGAHITGMTVCFLFIAMRSFVASQISSMFKTFPTNITKVRSFIWMSSLMYIQAWKLLMWM